MVQEHPWPPSRRRALNPKLGNHAWSYKAELLQADNLEMNRRLLNDMEGETWNEREINRRSQIIADYVNDIWPDAAALRRELEIARRRGKRPRLRHLPDGRRTPRRQRDGVRHRGRLGGQEGADPVASRRALRAATSGSAAAAAGTHVVWFGMSPRDRQLVLSSWDPKDAPDRFITVPDGVGFDEVIEFRDDPSAPSRRLHRRRRRGPDDRSVLNQQDRLWLAGRCPTATASPPSELTGSSGLLGRHGEDAARVSPPTSVATRWTGRAGACSRSRCTDSMM